MKPKPKIKPRCPPKLLSQPVKPGKPSLTLCQRFIPQIGLNLGMDRRPSTPSGSVTVFTTPDGLTVFTTPDDTTVFTAS